LVNREKVIHYADFIKLPAPSWSSGNGGSAPRGMAHIIHIITCAGVIAAHCSFVIFSTIFQLSINRGNTAPIKAGMPRLAT
jgi:hypothetical protein